MKKEQALTEIKAKKTLADAGFWFTVLSCTLMIAGLLGFALFHKTAYYIASALLFAAGVFVFILTLVINRSAKKRCNNVFLEDFLIPAISNYFTDVKSEKKLAITKQEVAEHGFYQNLQWTDVEGKNSFSAKIGDVPVKFCELGIYHIFNIVPQEGKSFSERDYIFRGRFFDVEISLGNDKAYKISEKIERYNLCNKGTVRADYINGHMYIFHNVIAPEKEFEHWLSLPEETDITGEETEKRLKAEIEPYATMLKYVFEL